VNADPLAALRPLHAPAAIGWWPPAPLWWLLALLGTALLMLGLRALWRWLRGRGYRRAAGRELSRARQEAVDAREYATRAAQVLRRAALVRYGPREVAGLVDAAWLEFLDRSARMQGFVAGAGQALARAPYDPAADCDPAALDALCRRWLRRHR